MIPTHRVSTRHSERTSHRHVGCSTLTTSSCTHQTGSDGRSSSTISSKSGRGRRKCLRNSSGRMWEYKLPHWDGPRVRGTPARLPKPAGVRLPFIIVRMTSNGSRFRAGDQPGPPAPARAPPSIFRFFTVPYLSYHGMQVAFQKYSGSRADLIKKDQICPMFRKI